MPNDSAILRGVRRIMSSGHLNYTEAAIVAGISPTTLRIALATDTLPERAHARAQIVRFVECNSAVASRHDLRFV